MTDTRALREDERAASEIALHDLASSVKDIEELNVLELWDAAFKAGLRYRDGAEPKVGGSSLLWSEAEPSEAEVEAAMLAWVESLVAIPPPAAKERLTRAQLYAAHRAALEAARKASP